MRTHGVMLTGGAWRDGAGPRWLVLSLLAAATASLSACGHRELKAPCAPGEGAVSIVASRSPEIAALIAVEDRRPDWPAGLGPLPVQDALREPCGPLRPANRSNLDGETSRAASQLDPMTGRRR